MRVEPLFKYVYIVFCFYYCCTVIVFVILLLLLVLSLLICDHHGKSSLCAGNKVPILPSMFSSEDQFDYLMKQQKEGLYCRPDARSYDFTKSCCEVQKFATLRSRAEKNRNTFYRSLITFLQWGSP